MKYNEFTYELLNDYMDIDVTPKEYSDRLTMTGSKLRLGEYGRICSECSCG